MSHQVGQLYQLQKLEIELVMAKKRLNEIEQLLAGNEALTQALAAAEAAEQAAQKARTAVLNLELEVKSINDKAKRQEELLYGGQPKSAKEAANLQDEVAGLKRLGATREEQLLEAMVVSEEAESKLKAVQAALSSTQAKWDSEQAGLVAEQGKLKTKVKRTTEQRAVMVEAINQPDLQVYSNLRKRKAGRPIAAVKNGSCQACGVDVPRGDEQRARAGKELTYCNSCGRILYPL